MIYIGIDPGVTGGIAVIEKIGIVLNVLTMPSTPRDLLDALQPYYGVPSMAIVERVHSMPGQGHSGAFTFGRGVGRIETALAATRIPCVEVTPRTWQAAMSCLTGGNKNVSKHRAQQLFPNTPITHAIADALLLAEYGRRLEHGITRRRR